MNKKILIIDDDPGLLSLLKLGLEREGFLVVTARNGKEGLRQAYDSRPDAIILDIMMPELDGWSTIQQLRHLCDTPIIILTARKNRKDVLKGLSLGADDYLTKPCSFDELKARLETIMRRAEPRSRASWRSVFESQDLKIDLTNGSVWKNGDQVHLAPTESRLLLYLVSQKDRIVPHRELLVSVWGPECADEVGYLSVYIRYLRRKLEDDPDNPQYIRTRWGVGYFFAGEGVFRTETDSQG